MRPETEIKQILNEHLQWNRELNWMFVGLFLGVIGNLVANRLESLLLRELGEALYTIGLVFVMSMIVVAVLLFVVLKFSRTTEGMITNGAYEKKKIRRK